MSRPVLHTQAQVDAYLTKHVAIGQCIPVTLAPTERIDLSKWIGPWECCSHCGTATEGLRLDGKGVPIEDCAECGTGGFLITCWGEAQKDRWEDGERYGSDASDDDDGPQVGPIQVCGGRKRFVADIKTQAERALIRFERADPLRARDRYGRRGA